MIGLPVRPSGRGRRRVYRAEAEGRRGGSTTASDGVESQPHDAIGAALAKWEAGTDGASEPGRAIRAAPSLVPSPPPARIRRIAGPVECGGYRPMSDEPRQASEALARPTVAADGDGSL